MRRRLLATLAAAAVLAGPASAHLVETGFGAFYDGIAHVFLAPADLLAVLAFALLGGLRGKEAARSVLFSFPLAWLLAGAAAARWDGGPVLELAATASTGVAGLLVALDARLGRRLVVCFGVGTAVLHGLADAPAPEAELPALLAGTTLALFSLLALLAALVVRHPSPLARIVVRVGGSWIAASGLLLCAWLLRAPSG